MPGVWARLEGRLGKPLTLEAEGGASKLPLLDGRGGDGFDEDAAFEVEKSGSDEAWTVEVATAEAAVGLKGVPGAAIFAWEALAMMPVSGADQQKESSITIAWLR